jgi:hypothetical protein
MTTPLYHASVSGITGLAFTIGPSLYFAPVDDTRLYCVEDETALVLTSQVDPEIALYLAARIVEPRLLALAGGGR